MSRACVQSTSQAKLAGFEQLTHKGNLAHRLQAASMRVMGYSKRVLSSMAKFSTSVLPMMSRGLVHEIGPAATMKPAHLSNPLSARPRL